MSNRSTWMLALAYGLYASACHTAPTQDIRQGNAAARSWTDAFQEREIELARRDTSHGALVRITQVALGPKGHLFIPDGRAGRVLVYSQEGSFLREIGARDAFSPTVVSAISMDSSGNLFVYDPAGRTVTVLEFQSDRVLATFKLDEPATVIHAMDEGGIATFFPGSEHPFILYNRNGRRLSRVKLGVDQRLRIFHGRVQTGGFAQKRGGGFFGIHPGSFAILELSPELDVLRYLRGRPGHRWAPEPLPLPAGLSPYAYNSAHERWWDSFLHIGRLFSLTDDVFLLTLFRSRGLAEAEEFVNIYTADGRVIAEGLAVPHEGQVVGGGDGKLYVVKNARLSDGGSLEPLRLFEYSSSFDLTGEK